MDLQSLGSSTATLLEQPSVKLNLKQNFGVVVLVDATSHLRVSNQVAVAIEDEEVGNADNLDIGSADSLRGKKGGLIQDRNFLFDGVRSLSHLLVERSGAHIGKRPESRQMVSLVPESEPTQD